MKTQKSLVIVALVCLMAFFNILSFAQTTPGRSYYVQPDDVQPDLAGSMAEVLAQILAAQGYEVSVDGTAVKIATQRGELSLDLPATDKELEDSGIWARLVPQADTLAEDPAANPDDLLELINCLDAADLLFKVSQALCLIGPNDVGTFICETAAVFERILDTLECIATYVPQPPPSGDVVSVFVTQTRYQGNLGGLAGADDICQQTAKAAGLPETDWTAWLSDSTGNAIDRIPDGQYRLLDDTQVADDKADLTDGLLKAAINLNEDGQPQAGLVWTGTQENGTDTGSNCNDWTDNSSNFGGSFGASGAANSQWTELPYDPAQCSERYHLYCFGGGVE